MKRAGPLVVLSLVSWLGRGAAQGVVVGSVTDSATATPLAGAEILTAGAVVSRADGRGSFALTLPAGWHDLAARMVGYGPTGVRILVTDHDTTTLIFRLAGAQRLPTLTTNVARPATGTLAGFATRREGETGAFITEDMLVGQEHRPLSGALQAHVTGARFVRHENETIATGRGGCAMAVWVDGLRLFAGTAEPLGGGSRRIRRPTTGLTISSASSDGPPNLDNWKVGEIAAIEIYVGPGRTPAQFQVTGSACGTILIWTKAGGAR